MINSSIFSFSPTVNQIYKFDELIIAFFEYFIFALLSSLQSKRIPFNMFFAFLFLPAVAKM